MPTRPRPPKITATFNYKPPAQARWGTLTHDGMKLAAVLNEKGEICRLHLRQGAKGQAFLPAWKKAWPATEFRHDQKAVNALSERLAKGGGTLPICVTGTRFQREVWQNLLQVPAGQVVTYKELAQRSKRPRAARAVGNICGANPVPLFIPCHRVVASDGSLGGFGFGLPTKIELLRREGITGYGPGKEKRA